MEIYKESDFTQEDGFYYSPILSNLIGTIVVGIKTDNPINGTVEKSITNKHWATVTGSHFTINDYDEINVYDIPQGQSIRFKLDKLPDEFYFNN